MLVCIVLVIQNNFCLTDSYYFSISTTWFEPTVAMMMMMSCLVSWLTEERRLVLFPAGTIVKVPHHCKLLMRCKQDLTLHRT